MPSFWRVLNQVIDDADILVEVLDARDISGTRNKELEDKAAKRGKRLIFAINKCDLVDRERLDKEKKSLENSVYVSATERLGTAKLREHILKNSGSNRQVKVGIVGYPNTGKSSIINALVGREKAKASSESGFTKGMKYVKVSSRILLIDSPGVIPYREKDEKKHGSTGSVDHSKVKDAEAVVMRLLEEHKQTLLDFYSCDDGDIDHFLEHVASMYNFVKKGAEPNLDRAARKVIRDYQSGKIK